MGTYGTKDVERAYENLTSVAIIEFEFISPLVGGQPASRDGVEQFVIHHLGKTGEDLWEYRKDDSGEWIMKRGGKNRVKFLSDEGEAAVRRIREEEIRNEDVTPETGEVKERESYAVQVLRRSEHGPFIGDWQVKACFKQAASRRELFKKKVGSKGDMAEVGRACAVGTSLIGSKESDRRMVHLYDEEGNLLKDRIWERIHGRVQTAKGAQSIVNDCEIAPIGTRGSFEFRWYPGKIREADFLDLVAIAGNCGFGSARSLERGKWKTLSLEILDKAEKKEKAEAAKEAKKKAKAAK